MDGRTPVWLGSDGALPAPQVDADAHRELGERFGVRGFPTIKFFGRGKAVKAPEE
jgi:protein disulfide-isomerase A6